MKANAFLLICLLLATAEARRTGREKTGRTKPAPRRLQVQCQMNPFQNRCLFNTEFIIMIERMEPNLFNSALDFAQAILNVVRTPMSVLTFGQTDQAIPCGWYSCTRKNNAMLRKDLDKLRTNPPQVEMPRVAYAIDFGTEFPAADRFGGKQDSRHILILIGSGQHDPKESAEDYQRVLAKANRLHVSVLYLDIGEFGGARAKRSIGAGHRDLVAKGIVVVDIDPKDMKDVDKVWGKTKMQIFPPNE